MKGLKNIIIPRSPHFMKSASRKILKSFSFQRKKISFSSIYVCQSSSLLNVREILMLCVDNLCSISRILKPNKNGMFDSICGNKQIIFGNFRFLCLIVAVTSLLGWKIACGRTRLLRLAYDLSPPSTPIRFAFGR